VLALLVLGQALAGAEAWESIYDGRLVEALGNDPNRAVAEYAQALSYLPDDSAERPELHYWLGRARWTAGDVTGARAALHLALGDPRWQDRAWAFLSRLEAQALAIAQLPYHEDFTTSFGAIVRGWNRYGDGAVDKVDGVSPYGAALQWKTTVRDGEPDFLYVAFQDLRRAPRTVRAFMRSLSFPAHVRFVAQDAGGRRWTSPIVVLSTTEWAPIDLGLRDFVLEEDPQTGRLPADVPIRFLMIHDMTAQQASDRGDNAILLDDFEVL
jgi:hypothetical protein